MCYDLCSTDMTTPTRTRHAAMWQFLKITHNTCVRHACRIRFGHDTAPTVECPCYMGCDIVWHPLHYSENFSFCASLESASLLVALVYGHCKV